MIEYLELSVKNLFYRKLRAFLTLLGVIIGITAVVSMISIGAGMSKALDEQLKSFGTNKIIVSAGASSGIAGKGLTDSDVRAVGRVLGVDFVSPMYSVSSGTEFKGEEKVATVWGLDPENAEKTFSDVSGYKILKGRWMQKGDRNNIVVGYKFHGYKYPDGYYKIAVNVGNTIRIQGEKFTVVGIFDKTGDATHDSTIFADLDRIRELTGKGDSVTTIVVRTKEGYKPETVKERIESLMKNLHEDTEFVIMTSQQMLETIGSAFKIVQIVFGGIAAISMIVGGIGIANTMIMNVVERTREIGVMKATGADSVRILKIFVFEAGLIGLVGGSIGVFFGYLLSKAINVAADEYLGPEILKTAVTPQIVLLALTFSFAVGILSGLYPAYRAVKLDPVKALRA